MSSAMAHSRWSGPCLRIGSTPPRRWLDSRGSQVASWVVSRKPEAQHDVDLRGDEDRVVVEVEQHDVDDAVGRLDLRPLVALEHVLDDQRVEPEGGAHRLDLLARRAGQVDPDAGVRLAQQGRERARPPRRHSIRGTGRRSTAATRMVPVPAGRDGVPSTEPRPARPARPVTAGRGRCGGGLEDGAGFGGFPAIGIVASGGDGRVGGGRFVVQHTRPAAEHEGRRDGQGGHRRRPRRTARP